MNEGLLRQRRNLIIVCIFLWIMKFGGVATTFSKLSFAGLDIEFKNPDALIQTIWIAFAYFFFRYYQYFVTDGIKVLHQVLNEVYEQRCSPVIQQFVKKKIHLNDIKKSNNPYYKYKNLKINDWMFRYSPKTNSGDHYTHEFKITRWMLKKQILFAWIDVFFRNKASTDYLLPFFLSFFILYYCGSNDWNGSFLRFFFS